MNTAPLGLGVTGLPWAVMAKVGRPGGRGSWSLAVPKSQDRQIPPISARRSVRKPREVAGRAWASREGLSCKVLTWPLVCQIRQRISSLLQEAKTQAALVLDRLEERQE